MKKRNRIAVIMPVIITVCLYIVFSSKIDSKPTDAGFWMILAMGISLGAAICRLLIKKRRNE